MPTITAGDSLWQRSDLLLWSGDRSGRRWQFSTAWQSFTGLNPERSAGLGWLQAIDPADRERIEHGLAAWSQAPRQQSWQYRLVGSDGMSRPVIDTVSCDREGSGCAGHWTPLTRDHQALRDTYEGIYLGLAHIDRRSLTIQHCNRALNCLFAGNTASLVGQDLTVFLHPRHVDVLRQALEGLHRRQPSITVRSVRCRDYRQQPLWIDLCASLLVDDSNDTCVISIHNITPYRSRLLRLQERARESRAYVDAASHDLLAPLRSIATYLDLIAEEIDGDPREHLHDMLTQTRDGTQRMRHLIDGILSYSKADHTTQALQQVDLDRCLDDALANLSGLLHGRDLTIARRPLPHVAGHTVLLTQCFQNLLSNAIRHVPDHGRISIEAQPEGNEWHLTVSDDGPGIAKDLLPHVFKLFHTGRANSGNGIGLAFCHKAIERCGGDIWVESEEGHGATFHLLLASETPPEDSGGFNVLPPLTS